MTVFAGSRCPSERELSRALSSGASPALTAHLAGCAPCAALWHELAQPGQLARDLPSSSPGPAELEQTRTRLLIALGEERLGGASRPAPPPPARRRTVLATSALVAVAAAVVAWRLPRAPRGAPAARAAELHTPHAVVRPRPGAVLERAGSAADDIVRLREGAATFDVMPLPTGERFRVVAGNGEVEVRGTFFEVVASADRLMAVHVERGRVEVRVAGRGAVVLGPGDDWTSAAPGAGKPRAAVAAPSASGTAFIEAWSAFRAGRLVGAIEGFEDVLRLDPTGPLAEDARYWKAVARARTGSRLAIDELRAFLADYPGSAHVDQASLLLGWKLLEGGGGRRDEAARAFRSALAARDSEVRKSARAGMQKLDEKARP